MNVLAQIPSSRRARTEHRKALRKVLMDLNVRSSSRKRPRMVIGLSIILATVGGAAATAAVYVHFRPVTNTNYAHCYSFSKVGDNGTAVAVAGKPGSDAQVTNAIGTCSMLWRDGFLANGVSHVIRVTESTTIHPIPSLVVCTMPNGTAGVFPGTSSTCAKLGLPKPKKN